jgi:hypothetical protein
VKCPLSRRFASSLPHIGRILQGRRDRNQYPVLVAASGGQQLRAGGLGIIRLTNPLVSRPESGSSFLQESPLTLKFPP